MMKQIYRRARAVLTLFLLAAYLGAFAQSTIKGKIVDGTGQALPGVNVIIKGTTVGTSTDADGVFTISAGSTDVLVFSFIGYATQEIMVGAQTNINVVMQEDVSTLQEVVVNVGYGSQQTRNLSSAQSNITETDLKRTVNTSIEQALQGRAANVYVSSNSGKPGGAASVYIRGVSSINGNTQPMYVIDGVQIIPPANTDVDGQSNILASINPEDIESMNVLSGPNAQSIYGSKASNGVIVVTTKKGRTGDTKINFSSQYNLQALPKQLPTMNLRQYAEYSNAWADVLGYGRQAEFADPSILGNGTNWQSALFKTAAMKKQNLTISGGSDKTTFYLSGELMGQDGIAPNSDFNRKSVRMNLENNLRSYLKVGANVMLTGTSEKLSIGDDQIVTTAIQQAPSTPLYNGDGTWGGPQNITPTTPSYTYVTNPVALAYTNSNTYKRNTTLGTVYGEVMPIKGLVIHAEFNGNYGNDTRAVFKPSYQFGANNLTQGASNKVTISQRYDGNNYYWSTNQRITYAKKIDKHDFTVTVGHEAQKSFSETLSGSVQGYTSNNIPELSAGDTKTSISGSSRDASSQESYFSRIGYIFNDKYIISASYRADASSNFGPNNRWGYFPSASVAWRVSDEPFMKGVAFINDLKLRAEAGKTGNQYYGKPIYAALTAVPTQTGQGFIASNFANPDLKWESTSSYNVGIDLDAFQGRVHVTFDAYFRKTSNLINNLPLPAYAGTAGSGSIGSPIVNLGDLQNKGIGLSVNVVPIDGRVTWRSGFNISFDRNKLVKLNTDRAFADRKPWFTDVISRSSVGQPLWQFFSYQYDGIFQTYDQLENSALPANVPISPTAGVWVGDVKFKDANGDGIIDDLDRRFIGNPWPKFMFGFTNSVAYKNFTLSVFIQGVYGNKIFNQLKLANSGFTNLIRGAFVNASNFARPNSLNTADAPNVYLLNPGTDVPRVGNTPNGNGRATDKFIEDGSYARIKNISLSYSIPRSVIPKGVPIQGIRATVGVQNAYTFTNYSGYDPEVGTQYAAGSNLPGFDNGRYPSARMYTFALSVDF